MSVTVFGTAALIGALATPGTLGVAWAIGAAATAWAGVAVDDEGTTVRDDDVGVILGTAGVVGTDVTAAGADAPMGRPKTCVQ